MVIGSLKGEGAEEDHFDLNPLGAQIEPVLVPLVVPPLGLNLIAAPTFHFKNRLHFPSGW